MAIQFQQPPTWAPVVVDNGRTGEKDFNPIWLKWFLDIVSVINASGGGGGGILHNGLPDLQGGVSNQFYHLTAAEYAAVQSSRSNFMVYQSVGQVIGAGAFTDVTFTTKVFDDLIEVSGTGVFTPTVTGTYLFSSGFTGTQVVVTNRQLGLFVNGIERVRLQSNNVESGIPIIAGAVVPVKLTAGDAVTIRYFTGVADTGSSGQAATYFGGYRLK